jgi:hypothetical protein
MLALTHADEKGKRKFSTEKHPQNSSYKAQPLHAAVLLQSGGNRLRALVSDLVAALQNSCWSSRTPTKKANANSAHQKKKKFILQAIATGRCCSVAERRKAPSLLRRRFGCLAAKLMSALTHAEEKGKREFST